MDAIITVDGTPLPLWPDCVIIRQSGIPDVDCLR
jgi:hypothetical protein